MNEIGEIPEEKRKKLGDYIENLKLENKFGFNQLALKSGINVRSLNEILYGKGKRINPFSLQRLGLALRIDYKDLYKIVGYLSEDDFKESDNLKLELKNYKIKYEELEKEINDLKSKKSFSSENQDKKNEINLSGLSPERIEELKRYAEFLKTQ